MNDTPTSDTTDPARLEELRPGVYAWVQPDGSWWVNNAGAVAGGDGVLVIDTCATARAPAASSTRSTPPPAAPVRMAVNTHQHGDHAYGNSLLPATTVLIGHETCGRVCASTPSSTAARRCGTRFPTGGR